MSFYISNPNEYIIDPCPGHHINSAPSINILQKDAVMQKLLLCLDIAGSYGCEKVNLHLVGNANVEPASISDKIIKEMDQLGFINTHRALKGNINRPYHWTGIQSIKMEYLPKIKDLKEFGISFDKFACARCALQYDSISRALQVAGNEKGFTILYQGVEENEIKAIFQKLFEKGRIIDLNIS